MAQYAHLSVPDPEWAAVSAHMPPAQPIVSFQAFREEVSKFRATLYSAEDIKEGSKARVVEERIQVENGEIRVKAYIPDSQVHEADGFPLILWMFGGGWVAGTIEDDEPFLRSLAVNSRVVCVCPDYRKAPEHPFPAAVNDSYAGLKWALRSAPGLSINVSKGIILGGISAGGNIAAVLAHRSSKDPEVKDVITGQLLLIPCVISPHAYPERFKSELLSLDTDQDKYFLSKFEVLQCSEAYHSGRYAADPGVSPALSDSFEGLPPAYIQVCGLDPVRDDGFLYERLLKEAGVPTRVDVYPGLPHGFHVFFKDFQATRKQKKDFEEGLNWLLSSTK